MSESVWSKPTQDADGVWTTQRATATGTEVTSMDDTEFWAYELRPFFTGPRKHALPNVEIAAVRVLLAVQP